MCKYFLTRFIVTLIVLFAAIPLRAASLRRVTGLVQVQGVGFGPWRVISRVPRTLSSGEKIRTGPGGSATLIFSDGSRLDLEDDASLILESVTGKRRLLRLVLGTAVLDERGTGTRLITPTAVAAVRESGASFRASVLAGGRTSFQLFQGLVGVEDNRGHQVLLRPRESLRVDLRGMAVPRRLPTGSQMRKSDAVRQLRREMSYDAQRDARMARSSADVRRGELELGKALIDRDGKRVRSESYILRPSKNEFKYVSLTGRDSGIDYFYYHGTFNSSLPGELSTVWAEMFGVADSGGGRTLTGYETGVSNGVDSVRTVAQGGHLVDLNANADATDDVSTVFDDSTDSYLDATGRAIFVPLFDQFGVYLNGKLKRGWTGTNIQSQGDAVASTATDPFSGAALTSTNAFLDGTGFLASRTESTGYPDSGVMRQSITESYSDGSFTYTDNFVVDGDSGVSSTSNFGTATSGTGFRMRLLDFNLQHVISATEFAGRKIDLFVAPRMMILTGLIQ